MDKLKVLFDGYSKFPPTCFIFCGNFLSSHLGNNHAKVLKGIHLSFIVATLDMKKKSYTACYSYMWLYAVYK